VATGSICSIWYAIRRRRITSCKSIRNWPANCVLIWRPGAEASSLPVCPLRILRPVTGTSTGISTGKERRQRRLKNVGQIDKGREGKEGRKGKIPIDELRYVVDRRRIIITIDRTAA
jgi:hypothetical protein